MLATAASIALSAAVSMLGFGCAECERTFATVEVVFHVDAFFGSVDLEHFAVFEYYLVFFEVCHLVHPGPPATCVTSGA